MIKKHFELKNINLKEIKFFLLYGNNSGLMEDIINNELKPILSKNFYNYEENEILKNEQRFKEEILNKSFFENEKVVKISRITDKFYKIFEDIIERDIQDISFILTANTLEKKSKMRNLFEKNKNTVCIPFYEDNHQALSLIAKNFFSKNNIKISNENLNIIIDRSLGNRKNLNNELLKIQSFMKNRNKIETLDIIKLTNLAENFSISELVDNSLAKNKRKTLNILNENNFVTDDCILILRTFLIKLKRLLNLKRDINNSQNIEYVISNYKPPIFWKEKEIIKKQIKILSENQLIFLIAKINNVELLIKKYPSSSINIVNDFIFEQTN